MLRNRPSRRGRRRPPVDLFVTAAAAGDLGTTRTLAEDYLGQTRSRTALVTDLLDAAIAQVSRLWRSGAATADDENNVATAIADVNDAIRLDRPTPSAQAPKALLVTVEPEQHSLGLKLVATALREDGWDTVTMVSAGRAELIERVTAGGFSLVAISATYLTPLSERMLAGAVEALKTLGKPVIVGGQAFQRNPDLRELVGAAAFAGDPRSAMVVARRFRKRDTRRGRRESPQRQPA